MEGLPFLSIMSVKRPVAAIVNDDDEQAIPQDMLDIAAATNRAIQIRQDNKSAADGEIHIKGVFRSFIKVEKGGGMQELSFAPERSWIQRKSDNKSFPKPFDLQVQVLSMTPVKDVCEALPDGTGFKVKMPVTYSPDAKKWLLDTYQLWYGGHYKGTFPIGDYVDPHGNVATEIWQKFEHKAKIRINATDNDSSPFRRRNKNKTGPEVTSRTCMTFLKCGAKQEVKLKQVETEVKEEATAASGPVAVATAATANNGAAVIAPTSKKIITFVPQAFTNFQSKGVELDEDHDSTMQETERFHLLENKDAHQMVPIDSLRNGSRHVPSSAYFYAANGYQTRFPAQDGVTIFKIPVEELKDFYTVYDGNEQCRHTVRLNMFQWHGDPSQTGTKEQYSVKVVCAKKAADLWQKFGITDKQSYGHIIHANQHIPLHVECQFGRDATLKDDNNKPENLKNATGKFALMCGFYTYWANSIVPDYPRFFPTKALRISRDRLGE